MMACFILPMSLGIITLIAKKAFPDRMHIEWLNMMLWGASIMLAVEHVAHGEIMLIPPFLTAGIPEILPEMLAVGGPMTVFSVSAWAAMVMINNRFLAGLSAVNVQRTVNY